MNTEQKLKHIENKYPSIWKHYTSGLISKEEILKDFDKSESRYNQLLEKELKEGEILNKQLAELIKIRLKENPNYSMPTPFMELEHLGIKSRITFELI